MTFLRYLKILNICLLLHLHNKLNVPFILRHGKAYLIYLLRSAKILQAESVRCHLVQSICQKISGDKSMLKSIMRSVPPCPEHSSGNLLRQETVEIHHFIISFDKTDRRDPANGLHSLLVCPWEIWLKYFITVVFGLTFAIDESVS